MDVSKWDMKSIIDIQEAYKQYANNVKGLRIVIGIGAAMGAFMIGSLIKDIPTMTDAELKAENDMLAAKNTITAIIFEEDRLKSRFGSPDTAHLRQGGEEPDNPYLTLTDIVNPSKTENSWRLEALDSKLSKARYDSSVIANSDSYRYAQENKKEQHAFMLTIMLAGISLLGFYKIVYSIGRSARYKAFKKKVKEITDYENKPRNEVRYTLLRGAPDALEKVAHSNRVERLDIDTSLTGTKTFPAIAVIRTADLDEYTRFREEHIEPNKKAAPYGIQRDIVLATINTGG